MSDAFKLPTEPYPGLRPFLDHEAALLQGRGNQIEEVIERLARTQFVAVVGGSGCGKSSLIRAGVVPRLRAWAISDAGAYWVPVVCTPGTTPHGQLPALTQAASDAPAPPAEEEQTPLTRLAWKFDKVLAPLADAQATATRRREIAAVFGRGSGFSRLAEVYTEDLPNQGAERSEARFLFVIDQFEELFHPNNRGSADARLLVEAVISHFFNPHPRCHVVMTMRSEHLADCASYLDLPDAINRSIYLVRRLSEVEIRDAIVGPAKYYLRLCQRAGTPGLPDDISFDPLVVERLLADVAAVVDDPDHLPLLQHVLARTWEAACVRENCAPQGVPTAVTMADLDRAALPPGLEPNVHGRPRSVPDGAQFNVLRASLDNYAQLKYEQPIAGQPRSAADRAQFDALLRRLGYRDPNNGLYFQQRLEIDDADLLPGEADPRGRLKALLERGFLDEVNYLYWDRENPDCETLKVSHESFIRGWDHFRKLVDREAERFDEFMALLRRCAVWNDEGQSDDPALLLEPAELSRLAQAELDAVLADPRQRENWFRVLLQSRDGARLAAVEPFADRFVAQSRQLRAAQEKARIDSRRRADRNHRRLLIAVGVAVAAIAVTLVTYPVLQIVESYASAKFHMERLDAQPGEGATIRQLGRMLHSARTVIAARDESLRMLYPWSRSANWVPLIGTAGRLPDMSTSESVVNGRLRHLLTRAMFRSDSAGTAPAAPKASVEKFKPIRRDGIKCLPIGAEASADFPSGTVFIDASVPAGSAARALFVPEGAMAGGQSAELAFYAAHVSEAGGCTLGAKVYSIPMDFAPRALLDARLLYMAVAFRAPTGRVKPDDNASVTLYEISWGDAEGRGLPQRAGVSERWVAAEAVAARTFDAEFGARNAADARTAQVRSVDTWREPGGAGFSAGGQAWRVLDRNFERLLAPDEGVKWQPLAAGDGAEQCQDLVQAMSREPQQPGFRSAVYGYGERCLEIKRGIPVGRAPGAANPGDAEQVFVSLYDQLNPGVHERLAALPAAIASIEAYRSRSPAAGADETWLIGMSGPYHGWIAVRRKVGAAVVVEGAPLTTEALVNLGSEFCAHSVAAATQAGAALPAEASLCAAR